MESCSTCGKSFLDSTAYNNHLDDHKGIISAEKKQQYLSNLLNGDGPLTSATKIGITPRQLKKAIQESPTFEEDIKFAEAQRAERVETKLQELAEAGDYRAIEKILNTRNPERWAPKADITVDIVHSIKELPLNERIPKIEALLQDRLSVKELENPEIIDAEVIE